MKANELMLGDWVYGLYPNGDRYPRPFRISAVDTYPNNRSPRIVTEGGYGFQEEHLEPIPLTPEILEKNGFIKQGFPGWEIYTEDFLILWRNDYPDVLDIRSFNAKYGSFHRSHIRYVHELQHALRLCNIQKNIEI